MKKSLNKQNVVMRKIETEDGSITTEYYPAMPSLNNMTLTTTGDHSYYNPPQQFPINPINQPLIIDPLPNSWDYNPTPLSKLTSEEVEEIVKKVLSFEKKLKENKLEIYKGIVEKIEECENIQGVYKVISELRKEYERLLEENKNEDILID